MIADVPSVPAANSDAQYDWEGCIWTSVVVASSKKLNCIFTFITFFSPSHHVSCRKGCNHHWGLVWNRRGNAMSFIVGATLNRSIPATFFFFFVLAFLPHNIFPFLSFIFARQLLKCLQRRVQRCASPHGVLENLRNTWLPLPLQEAKYVTLQMTRIPRSSFFA